MILQAVDRHMDFTTLAAAFVVRMRQLSSVCVLTSPAIIVHGFFIAKAHETWCQLEGPSKESVSTAEFGPVALDHHTDERRLELRA